MVTCWSNNVSNSHPMSVSNGAAQQNSKPPLTWEGQDKNVKTDGTYTDLGCNVKHRSFARTQRLPELMTNKILRRMWTQQEMKYISLSLWRTTNSTSLFQICFQLLPGFQRKSANFPQWHNILCSYPFILIILVWLRWSNYFVCSTW